MRVKHWIKNVFYGGVFQHIIILSILTLMIYLPVIYGLKDAFIDDHGVPTLRYLVEVLGKPNIRHSIYFTFTQASISTLLSVAIGFLVAVMMTLTSIPGERIIRTISFLVFMAPPMIVVTGFTLLYGRYGFLTSRIPGFIVFGEGFWAIITAHTYYNIPLAMNFIYTSLTGIQRQYVDVLTLFSRGRILGVIRRVILPASYRSIISSSIIIFIYCFTSFAIPLSLGGIRYSTLEVYIYRYYKLSFNTHFAAAIAFIQFLVLFVLVAILVYMNIFAGGKTGIPVGRFRIKPVISRGKHLLFMVSTYIVFIYLIAPLLVIPYYSFIDPYRGVFSVEGYLKMFNPNYVIPVGVSVSRIYINTIYFAFMTAILTLTLSTILVLYGSEIIDPLYLGLLAISPLTLSMGLLRTYSYTLPLPLLIIFAHTIVALPIALRILRSGYNRIQRIYFDIVKLFGEKGLPFLFKVLYPLMKPAIITLIVFSLVISIGEFSATYFLSSTDTLTLSLSIYAFRGVRDWQASASAATILLLFTTTLLLPIIKRGEGVEIR